MKSLRSRRLTLSRGLVLAMALPFATPALAKVSPRVDGHAIVKDSPSSTVVVSGEVLLAKKGEKPAKGKKAADDKKDVEAEKGDEKADEAKGEKKDGEAAPGKPDEAGADRAAKAEAWKAKRLAAENSKHAMRLAKIEKIESIATEKSNADLTAQAAKLREAEMKRHTAHLEKIEAIAKKRSAPASDDDDDKKKGKDDKKPAKGAGKGKAGKPAKKGGR